MADPKPQNELFLAIGKRLIELREKRGMNQVTAAAALKILHTTYQKYEYGISKPNTSNLKKIIDYYGCSTGWLLAGEGVPYPDRPNEYPEGTKYDYSSNIEHISLEASILEEAMIEAGVDLNEKQKFAVLQIIRKEITRVEGEIANLISVFKEG